MSKKKATKKKKPRNREVKKPENPQYQHLDVNKPENRADRNHWPYDVSDETWYRMQLFCEHVSVFPHIGEACSKARLPRSRVFRFKREFYIFSRMWDRALEDGKHAVKDELHRRAMISDNILKFLAQSYFKEEFGANPLIKGGRDSDPESPRIEDGDMTIPVNRDQMYGKILKNIGYELDPEKEEVTTIPGHVIRKVDDK